MVNILEYITYIVCVSIDKLLEFLEPKRKE